MWSCSENKSTKIYNVFLYPMNHILLKFKIHQYLITVPYSHCDWFYHFKSTHDIHITCCGADIIHPPSNLYLIATFVKKNCNFNFTYIRVFER